MASDPHLPPDASAWAERVTGGHTTGLTISPAEFDLEFCEWLGHAISRWTMVEFDLARTLAAILDQPPMVGISLCYSSNTFKARLDLVRSAHTNLMQECSEKKEMNSVLKRIARLSSYRNTFIHSRVIKNDTGELLFVLCNPATNTFTEEVPAKTADLKNHATAVGAAAFSLNKILESKTGNWLRSDIPTNAIFSAPDSLPRIPQQRPGHSRRPRRVLQGPITTHRIPRSPSRK